MDEKKSSCDLTILPTQVPKSHYDKLVLSLCAKDQSSYWTEYKDTDPYILLKVALQVFCDNLNENSSHIYSTLKHINAIHKRYSNNQCTININNHNSTASSLLYSHELIIDEYLSANNVRFKWFTKLTKNPCNNLILLLNTSMDLPYNGVRHETLTLFNNWIGGRNKNGDDNKILPVAQTVFKMLIDTYSWRNKNKYYFLRNLLMEYKASDLLLTNIEDIKKMILGCTISLNYRHLISLGQQLCLQLLKVNKMEVYYAVKNILVNDTNYKVENCINVWLNTWPPENLSELYNELDLTNFVAVGVFGVFEGVDEDGTHGYLYKNNINILLLLRRVMQSDFERDEYLLQDGKLNKFIFQYGKYDDAQKISYYKLILMSIVERNLDIEALGNMLTSFKNFLLSTLSTELTGLRQEIIKGLPSIIYKLASILLKEGHEIVPSFISYQAIIMRFFLFIKNDIFESTMANVNKRNTDYQPVIFALRIYEMFLKVFHGCNKDQLFKQYDEKKIEFTKRCLYDEWELISMDNYKILIRLLLNEFEDIRQISCNIILMFFNDPIQYFSDWFMKQSFIKPMVEASSTMVKNEAQLFGKIFINYCIKTPNTMYSMYKYLQQRIDLYVHDIRIDNCYAIKTKDFRFYIPLSVLNEFYNPNYRLSISVYNTNPIKDLKYCTDISELILKLIMYGSDWNMADMKRMYNSGSASFAKMDENLEWIIKETRNVSIDSIESDKQQLLESFWMTLKVCGDLATSLGIHYIMCTSKDGFRDPEISYNLAKQCFNVSCDILVMCRHKGAIESAGISLGRFVRFITNSLPTDERIFQYIYKEIEKFFGMIEQNDTTRRGAGFPIIMHCLAKNDKSKERVLLHFIMKQSIKLCNVNEIAKADNDEVAITERNNYDNQLASVLHILCIIFKDSELKETISGYMVDVFPIAITTINSKEWTVRNAALQLFGAIVPKIVGQTQYFEDDDSEWDPVHLIYSDLLINMYKIHEITFSVLEQYVNQQQNLSASIVLAPILEFLSCIEIIDTIECRNHYNNLFLKYLANNSEKIRVLSARCLTRFHNYYEIPNWIECNLRILNFQMGNFNYEHGLILTICNMLKKYKSDSRYIIGVDYDAFLKLIRFQLMDEKFENYIQLNNCYLKCYWIDLLLLLQFSPINVFVFESMFNTKVYNKGLLINRILTSKFNRIHQGIGYNLWKTKMLEIYMDKNDIDG